MSLPLRKNSTAAPSRRDASRATSTRALSPVRCLAHCRALSRSPLKQRFSSATSASLSVTRPAPTRMRCFAKSDALRLPRVLGMAEAYQETDKCQRDLEATLIKQLLIVIAATARTQRLCYL